LAGWAESVRDYPVVVKPLRSAAGDCVVICDGPDQVRAAVKSVLAAETIYGEPNREALVQSYLRGPEYVVDTVSYQGRHYICGVWEYRKRLLPSGRNVYDREHLLSPDEEPAPELMDYVSRMLDALGVDYGPAHSEVIVTAEGATLVEVGTRIAGNMHPEFHTRCTGGNQATLTALAYLRPAEFLIRYAGRRYQKLSEAVCCTTSTTLNGVVDGIDERAVDQISSLGTVYGLDVKLAPGERIRPTVDLYSSTMRIFMCAPAMADIDRDYQRILQLKDRVYRVRDHEAGEQ
jgi:ATP-grasp domain